MRLVQFRDPEGARRVAMVGEGGPVEILGGVETVYELVGLALESDAPLTQLVTSRLTGESEHLDQVISEGLHSAADRSSRSRALHRHRPPA